MKLKQHINIGRYIIDNDIKDEFKVNKIAYLLGNIAPDLNCVYPAHRLTTTEKRFYKRLKIVEKSNVTFIRSFTLGVITHYVCDYFCCAHNNESLGIPHKRYEKNLYNYYESHLDELRESKDRLTYRWMRAKKKSQNDCLKSREMSDNNHCDFVLEQVKLMNEDYLKHTNLDRSSDWVDKKWQMQRDMEYAIFMSEHIITLIIEPFKCIVGKY
jgi:hypothetical protein